MGYKTYETDKYGRIRIYPSLNSPVRKTPGVLKAIIEKLIDAVRGNRKKTF
jgi:hypothetical protein